MNRPMRRRLLPLTGALVSLGLVAGCAGGEDTGNAVTGRERTSVEVTIPADGWSSDLDPVPSEFFTVGRWTDGTPALLVVEGDVTPASGLKKKSVRTTYTLYAPSGEKLGSSAFDGEDGTDFTVEAGHVRLTEDDSSPASGKKVLASGLEPDTSLNEDVDVLERTSDGHTLLATSMGVFVFAPEKA
ncbi:hypothetical protein B6E66_12465 [Streptomyces maremycinicus]|nr:hypothetical protein B6E66_12465 [Streptomyces sp. B9173]